MVTFFMFLGYFGETLKKKIGNRGCNQAQNLDTSEEDWCRANRSSESSGPRVKRATQGKWAPQARGVGEMGEWGRNGEIAGIQGERGGGGVLNSNNAKLAINRQWLAVKCRPRGLCFRLPRAPFRGGVSGRGGVRGSSPPPPPQWC